MPKGYGYGGESTMKKKGAALEMKGSMMHMGHDSAAKMYGSKSAMKMGHDSAMKMGHEGSAMKMGHSPMKMQGTFMSKHSSSALHMGHSPMKMENVIDRDAKSSGKNQYDKYGK